MAKISKKELNRRRLLASRIQSISDTILNNTENFIKNMRKFVSEEYEKSRNERKERAKKRLPEDDVF